MKLNLGCCDDVLPGWVNVDRPFDSSRAGRRRSGVEFQYADLAEPWPWADSTVDEIYAADIFEHLPDRIHTMNEAHRVLKPGGVLRMECPDASKGSGQWQDPTHVSAWTPNGLQYFEDGSPAHRRFSRAYGIKARFRVVELTERKYTDLAGGVIRCEVWKFRAVLEAVK